MFAFQDLLFVCRDVSITSPAKRSNANLLHFKSDRRVLVLPLPARSGSRQPSMLTTETNILNQ